MTQKSVPERFWEKVEMSEGCWVWKACTVPFGHGKFSVGKGWMLAHRMAWELAGGTIPPETMVLHTCDNPSCVRNDDEGWYELDGVLLPRRGHLFLGTREQNNRDKMVKSRQGEPSYGRAKLSVADAEEIRERRRMFKYQKGHTLPEIAAEYGVHPSTIDNISRGITYNRAIAETRALAGEDETHYGN